MGENRMPTFVVICTFSTTIKSTKIIFNVYLIKIKEQLDSIIALCTYIFQVGIGTCTAKSSALSFSLLHLS